LTGIIRHKTAPILLSLLILASFALGRYLAGSGFLHDGRADAGSWTGSGPNAPLGSHQILLVYVGSSTCGWSNLPWLPAVYDSIRHSLRARSDSLGVTFATLGIAIDWSIDDGLSHLRRFNHFDEITVGHSWLNLAALRYLWDEHPGEASTPQVLVVERMLRSPDQERGEFGFGLRQEHVLQRAVGVGEIRHWLETGVPLRWRSGVSEAASPRT